MTTETAPKQCAICGDDENGNIRFQGIILCYWCFQHPKEWDAARRMGAPKR